MEIFCAIFTPVNGNGSVPDAAIEDALDALELRLLVDRVWACSGCAGDYEDPDRTAWLPVDDEADSEADAEAESERTDDGGQAPSSGDRSSVPPR